jgi:hypothetical protein
MASLALMVCIIFLAALFIGPISILFGRMGFKFVSKTLGIIALIMGVYWLFFAPFPISTIGFIGIITGGRAFYR